jgi:hypothetical protein
MLFNFYIYNSRGKCLFYKEWRRPFYSLADDPEEERKLVFGMLFSLKDLTGKMSPQNSMDGLHAIRTNAYTLHHFQSVSGLMFVLNSEPSIANMHTNLKEIYATLFIEYVSRNALYQFSPNQPIECPLFERKLEEYLKAHSFQF